MGVDLTLMPLDHIGNRDTLERLPDMSILPYTQLALNRRRDLFVMIEEWPIKHSLEVNGLPVKFGHYTDDDGLTYTTTDCYGTPLTWITADQLLIIADHHPDLWDTNQAALNYLHARPMEDA